MSELIRTRVDLDSRVFSWGNDHRTPGIHLTDVIKDMLASAGIGKRHATEAEGGFTRADLDKFGLQGFLWEEVFQHQIAANVLARNPNEYVRIGEIACPMTDEDGSAFVVEYAGDALVTPIPARHIIMTIDALRILSIGDLVKLAEFKWTTKSANMRPEFDRPDWFWQARGYLYGLRALLGKHIASVEWHVHYAVGERWGTAPIYEQMTKDYSERECSDAWETIVGHAESSARLVAEHRWAEYL